MNVITIVTSTLCSLALLATAANAQCCDDCNADGRVSINELITAVGNTARGCETPLMTCCGDCDASGRVTINELVTAVKNSLDGCLPPGPRYVDNGDGTVTDSHTRLTWEKKVGRDGSFNYDDLHDVDNGFDWSGTCLKTYTMCQPTSASAAACAAGIEGPDLLGCKECSGRREDVCWSQETIWTWLLELNATQFAGYSDWRIPNIDELRSLLELTVPVSPRVNIAFHGPRCGPRCADVLDPDCSCTHVHEYVSSSSADPDYRGYVWATDYHFAYEGVIYRKDWAGGYVRAVRGP